MYLTIQLKSKIFFSFIKNAISRTIMNIFFKANYSNTNKSKVIYITNACIIAVIIWKTEEGEKLQYKCSKMFKNSENAWKLTINAKLRL